MRGVIGGGDTQPKTSRSLGRLNIRRRIADTRSSSSRHPQQSQERSSDSSEASRRANSEEGATRREVSPTKARSSGCVVCAV